MMRHGFRGCFQGVPPSAPDVPDGPEKPPYDLNSGLSPVLFRRFQLSRDLGIDLGTANTLIDVSGRGIMLAGGGPLVRGIRQVTTHETGLFTHIAEDPLPCVVNGCGRVLEDYKRYQRVLDTPDDMRTTVTA